MTAVGKFIGEEVEVHFQAETTETDLGVPRSPKFTEVGEAEIVALSILGVDVKDPDKLPSDLVNAIYELAEEVEFEPA